MEAEKKRESGTNFLFYPNQKILTTYKQFCFAIANKLRL